MKKLIKDILIAAIAAGIAAIICNIESASPDMTAMVAYYAAGVPLGWHLCSKVITALSFQGVLIKLIGALLVGMVALPVVLVLDLFGAIWELSAARKAVAR